MAYDSTLVLDRPVIAEAGVAAPAPTRTSFRRLERLTVLTGAAALGGSIGFFAAMSMGRLDLWMAVAMLAPCLVLSLHFASQTFYEALRREAYGCASASVLLVGALLAWPMTSLFIPIGSAAFFIAPALAVSALLLFASCWGGSTRAVYRMCAQGALVAGVAAHQGVLVIMG